MARWAPALAAVVLTIPCWRLPYEWDDFDLLERAQTLKLADFLPDPRLIFYRPLTRELYFGLVATFGRHGYVWAHLLNASILAIAVLLVASIGTRLGGPRLGFLSSAVFAGLGALPVLVGLVSNDQDLLAILCILASLRCHLDRESVWGVLWMAAAVLSKETSISLIPAMLAAEWISGQGWKRIRNLGLVYAALAILWSGIHPGLRILASRKFESGGTGYLGLDNPDRLQSLVRELLAVANLPGIGPIAPWSHDYTFPLVLAGGLLIAGIAAVSPSDTRVDRNTPAPSRIVALALMLLLLPMALLSAIARNWYPYYACIPGLGAALLIGLGLSRLPKAAGAVLLVGFLALGVVLRQLELGPALTTERSLRETAIRLNHVEAQFLDLHPAMPSRAHVLVSVGAAGSEGVYTHIHRFQALRIWYADSTLVTLRPENRVPTTNPELLFRITPDLTLVEIDPDGGRFRSAGARPRVGEIRSAVRSYAKAVAASGEAMRAASMLLSIPDVNPVGKQYDTRLAAALLFAGNEEREARQVLAALPPLPRPDALRLAAATVIETVRGADLDPYVLQAFEIQNDLEALRYLMRFLTSRGQAAAAGRMAARVQAMVPGDTESAALMSKPVERSEDRGTAPVLEN